MSIMHIIILLFKKKVERDITSAFPRRHFILSGKETIFRYKVIYEYKLINP